MKIYTKTGDKGETSLYDNTRVYKDSLRVESYGTIDELNSCLGLARNFVEDQEIIEILYRIQRELFDVAGELATKDREKFPEQIQEKHIQDLEKIIDAYIAKIDKMDKFIIPGSNKASASLHVARTVCRRAERRILTLNREESVSAMLIKYVNRLSDVIYALARYLETELKYVDFEKPSV
ncbi:cob(I)yrinic acid a,c-diamide adenosyltransferase [Geosporobacter ferrireducens]|uniref:Corrinoid adenosyltransferase n=1 Tax=Geosporobacter ferrireducens TaxID=1424294 RepID=A0A1D8GC46_9FIRM|nr:cob(I)yrinic acid a,c-diamide adenosyltransferase [Geosporobacter ferrireducens]AOT68486.1 ATP:cob(I)alamin adenosyltransferase [Geosporobacter ferrireducens]MTI53948.1 cob(I)yrinic acid a,c-diamide adenosyltransferase [Geosporobacter ferrireducens]